MKDSKSFVIRSSILLSVNLCRLNSQIQVNVKKI